ncbi:helix-turn-helix domain-containing protein [Streptomyces sp. AD55]|uniref:helix-turn-helix domain-containing protein n=1 Tax=Streptomyces sp. AD55 TaxID=3242895 RepID=UPI003526F88A
MAGDEFSELLGHLKERSGLSYGALGKRLHTSTSTLHRYVNGDAVPTDYAPVERFARVCKATPEELVELHRRWVLADARRRQRASGATAEEKPRTRAAGGALAGAGGTEAGAGAGEAGAGAGEAGAGTAKPGTTVSGPAQPGMAGAGPVQPGMAEAGPGQPGMAEAEPGQPGRTEAEPGQPGRTEAGPVAPEMVVEAGPGGEHRPSAKRPVARRRTAVLAGAAALVSVSLAAALVIGQGEDGPDERRSVGAATRSVDAAEGSGASEPADVKDRPASPSASLGGSAAPSASASGTEAAGAGGAARDGGTVDGAGPPAVAVNPYKWEGPCSQHYLVDRKPERVSPPPSEPDARGWVTALGGVAGGQQLLALTVQGTGGATVVLEELHVRVVEKSAPLAWNDFVMGVGCGGGVETTAFEVDLDAGRPALSPKAGQRDFPYKVSESDPEVFYVFADTRAHHVSWYLELTWSSGDRRGTVRVDDNGSPFRTSGNVGRPAYTYPLGSSEWGRDEVSPDVTG